jgi:hypothetical protein
MNIQKIERKITRKVRHKLKKILNGYEIINSYNDGCDHDGLIYLYECKNGFDGESWEVKDSCDEEIKTMKKSIIDNGILYYDVRYYINPDIYYKDYHDIDLVKIISEKEYKILLVVKNNINTIINKIKKEIKNMQKYDKNDYINNICMRTHYNDIYYNADKLFNTIPFHSYNDFVKYIKTNSIYYKSKNIVIQILNSSDFNEERHILGIGS